MVKLAVALFTRLTCQKEMNITECMSHLAVMYREESELRNILPENVVKYCFRNLFSIFSPPALTDGKV